MGINIYLSTYTGTGEKLHLEINHVTLDLSFAVNMIPDFCFSIN